MLEFKSYRLREAGAVPAPAEAGPQNNDVMQQINKMVDDWVADLKKTLIDPGTPDGQQRGLWDRFKNSVSNLWHGRYNQKNPYFWQNKLGDDLGRTAAPNESFVHMPYNLSEYNSLRIIVNDLEKEINEADGTENLRIVQLIDRKAQQLKAQLASILQVKAPAPEAAPAAEEEEEEDTKPHANYELVKQIAQHLLKQGKIKNSKYRELTTALDSKKESIRMAAEKEITAIANEPEGTAAPTPGGLPPAPAGTTPMSNDAGKPADGEKPLEAGHAMRADVPPTTGKEWSMLDSAEREAWNKYGGGLENTAGKVDGCLNNFQIKKFPWILRIGDPRLQVLIDQEAGKLRTADGKCKNRRSFWLKRLREEGRLEDKDNPIKSWDDLEQRVTKLKAEIPQMRAKALAARMGKRTAPMTDQDRQAAIEATPPPAAEDSASPSTPLTPNNGDLKTRTAPINTGEIDNLKHTADNALGKPAHRNDGEEAPEKTADVPPANGEEKVKLLRRKAHLMDRIKQTGDDDLLQDLKRAKNAEQIDKVEERLTWSEKLKNGELTMDWTMNDLVESYKVNLRERKPLNKKKERSNVISFSENLAYYKELLKQQ